MSFETDKQTLDDLNILGKYKNNSIYGLFSGVITRGGERLLEQMFNNPLTDAGEINSRTAIFRYFKDHDIFFPESPETCDVVEQYLSGGSGQHWIASLLQLGKLKSLELVSNDQRLQLWRNQVVTTLSFLKKARTYLNEVRRELAGIPIKEKVEQGLDLLNRKILVRLVDREWDENLSVKNLFLIDKVLGHELNKELVMLMQLFHELDVYTVVGRVAREKGFCFVTAYQDNEVSMEIQGLFHPSLSGAISNDLSITKSKNIYFLTGANMAGKSTLMKSFGIAVYMAHMGFPVAAKSMRFTVQDGMYTSINVPDNINMGYSHFYAEVLRVKKVAEEVSQSKRLVVIFDELFKGTNVKDAFDATLAVSRALANRRACSFMISTHIIEVGQELGKVCDNVTFAYLPTVMKDKIPTYTYKLESGITSDKHGMIIINNERIIEIIRERKCDVV
jgi:putative mismatch repair-like protein